MYVTWKQKEDYLVGKGANKSGTEELEKAIEKEMKQNKTKNPWSIIAYYENAIMKPATLYVDLELKTSTIVTIATKTIITTCMLSSQKAKLALNFLFSYLSLLDVGIPGMCHPTSTFIGFVFEDEKIKT